MEVTIPYNQWLHQYDEDIKKDFPDRKTEEMAQEMDVNYYTVSRRATRLGVGKSEKFMHTSWKKGGSKKGCKNTKHTELSDAYLREHFANTKNEALAAHFGVDVKTIRRWARRLGLVKSEAFTQASRGWRSGIPFYSREYIAYRNKRIAEVYPDGDKDALQQLSDELGISQQSIGCLAYRIGLKRNRRPPQYLDELAAYFPTHTDNECAARFGIKKTQVQNIARSRGWKKTRDHMRRVYDSNIEAIKQSRIEKYKTN